MSPHPQAPTGAPWQNWARTATARPARVEAPASLPELQDAVARAAAQGRRVRMVGAGHSFTPVAVTEGVMLTPWLLGGIVSVDPSTCRATVLAGTTLHELAPQLWAHGLSMTNLGDIDKQTVAGAISTGTHGTGAAFGGLAAQVVAFELVLASGELVRASRDERPDLFDAARVGLGAFGVLATVTLQCVPAFVLDAVEAPALLDDVLTGLDPLVDGNDHFEFYWFPHTRRVQTKVNTRTPGVGPTTPLSRARELLDDELLSNTVFEAGNRLATWVPRLTRPLAALSSRALSARHYSDRSYRVFASPRRVVFREMEYALPRESLVDVLTEIDRWIEGSGELVPFPVEVRFAAPDDAWLSTGYGRRSAYVAVHQYHRREHERYFRAVESIAAAVGGRPHWGKLHYRDAASLRSVYPRFDDALTVRARYDPDGVFGNDHLARVLGAPELRR